MNSDAEVRNQGLPKAHIELPKIAFQAGMSVKTKETVPRPAPRRPHARQRDAESWLLTPDSCSSRNEGASGDVDENKGRCPRIEFRSPKSKGLCGCCVCSDSCLLTPDSCSSRNEGASGDVDENKGECPRIEFRSPKSKGLCGCCVCSDSCLLTPDSCSSRNEGASGDVDENKGGRQKGVRYQVSGISKCPPLGTGGPRGAKRE